MGNQREMDLFKIVNDYRMSLNLPPFIYDFNIYQIAMEHVYNIIISKENVDDNLQYRLAKINKGNYGAGENTAHVSSRDSAGAALRMWQATPTQLKNLQNPLFKYSAVACDLDLDGSWWVVQMYC